MPFLGFIIDSVAMKIFLSDDKIKQIGKEVNKILQTTKQVSARQLASLVGRLSVRIPARIPATLHYRKVQDLKNRAVAQGGYDQLVEISAEIRGTELVDSFPASSQWETYQEPTARYHQMHPLQGGEQPPRAYK